MAPPTSTSAMPTSTSSQTCSPPRQSSQIDLPTEEIDRLTSEVMRHMLFKNNEQSGVPVRREELVQLINKTYKKRNLSNLVISQAQQKFRSVLGFDMRELVRVRPIKGSKTMHSSQGGVTDMKCYVLKSILSDDLRRKFVDTHEGSVSASLTLLIVSIISLCGEKVPEDTLFLHLSRYGIKLDTPHPVFGDIKQCIESLIKQRYIIREKVSSSDGDSFFYELAERSLDKDVKSRLDSFIVKIVKDGMAFDTQSSR